MKLTNSDNSLAYTNWASFGRYKRFVEVRRATPYNIRLANYLPVSLMMPTNLVINNPYDEKIQKGCEDWELWICLICKGCKTSHAKILFFHRSIKKYDSRYFKSIFRNQILFKKNILIYTQKYDNNRNIYSHQVCMISFVPKIIQIIDILS